MFGRHRETARFDPDQLPNSRNGSITAKPDEQAQLIAESVRSIPNARCWRLASRGLEIKLAGLILFAGFLALTTLFWFAELDPRWCLPLIGIAALMDFAGRCMCVAAPLRKRLFITLSLVFQFFSMVAFAALALTGGVAETIAGIVVAAILQIPTAALFIQFMRAAGEDLRIPDAAARSELLNWRLAYGFLASSSLGLGILLASCLAVTLICLTGGVGWIIAIIAAAVAISPLVLLTIGVLVSMCWTYATTLLQLRSAIRKILINDNTSRPSEKV